MSSRQGIKFISEKVVARFLVAGYSVLTYKTSYDLKEIKKENPNYKIDEDKIRLRKKPKSNIFIEKDFYAWHIKDLEIFDEPLELSDFGLKEQPLIWQYVKRVQ